MNTKAKLTFCEVKWTVRHFSLLRKCLPVNMIMTMKSLICSLGLQRTVCVCVCVRRHSYHSLDCGLDTRIHTDSILFDWINQEFLQLSSPIPTSGVNCISAMEWRRIGS